MPDILAISPGDGYARHLSGLAIPADADPAYFLSQILWLLPGMTLSVVVGIAAGGYVARALDVRRAVAVGMVISLGLILAVTLTPLVGAHEAGSTVAAGCDLSRLGLAPLAELFAVSDTSLNVLLFVPLGIAIGLVARSRAKAFVLIAAILLPFAIEGVQLLVPALGRGCESADVVDNLTGLALGLVVGAIGGRLVPRAAIPERSA